MVQSLLHQIFAHCDIIARAVFLSDCDSESIIDDLKKSLVLPNENILQVGIELLLSGNDIAACHILVPQLEGILREFCSQYSTVVKIHNDRDQVLLFSSLVDCLREVSEEAADTIDIIFADQAVGWNLRNDIAHGLWSEAAANTHAWVTLASISLLANLDVNSIEA